MPANERTTDLQIRKKYELYGLAKIKGDKKNCTLKNLNLKASSIQRYKKRSEIQIINVYIDSAGKYLLPDRSNVHESVIFGD